MTELSKKPSYRADIQGLRGIAVLLVVIYHSGLPLFGGFIGVDVFFVLSGFVITEGMLRALNKGTFSFADFYTKRVRRLLPALAVMLSVVIATMFWLGPIVSRVFTVRTGVAAALLNANHYLIRGPSYFDPSTEYNALLHTWSLSVEEQFYLVFPLVLYLLWRVGSEDGRARRLMLGVGVLSIASFALCVWCSYTDRVFGFDGVRLAFYTALTRSWQFGAGVLIALAAPRLARSVFARSWTGWLGLAMILAAAFVFDKGTVFPGYAALLPTLGAALALISGLNSERVGLVARALSWRPLVRIGDLSYSWYLWHWPLIVFAAANFPHIPVEASVSAAFLSLGVAWLSERWVENPIRYRAPERRRPIVFVAALSMLLPVMAFGGQEVIARTAIQGARDAGETRSLVQDALVAREAYNAIGCDFAGAGGAIGDCEWQGWTGRRAILVGDSNARHFIPVVRDLAEASGWDLKATTFSSCPFADAYVCREGRVAEGCRRWFEEARREIYDGRYDVVIISNAVDDYLTNTAFSFQESENGTVCADSEKTLDLRDAIEREVREIADSGIEVVVVDPIPKYRPREESWITDAEYAKLTALTLRCSLVVVATFPRSCNATMKVRRPLGMETEIQHSPLVRSIDVSPHLCDNGTCQAIDLVNGRLVYVDAGHITPYGSQRVQNSFKRIFFVGSE